MPLLRTFCIIVFVMATLSTYLQAKDYSVAIPKVVEVIDGAWTDIERDGREVPYRIYLPKDTANCPIVIVSHGLGGNCKTYEYLGRHLAANGYVAIHLQHRGSDTDAIRDAMKSGKDFTTAMRESAVNIRNAIDRPKDVAFAIDQITSLSKPGQLLAGKINLKQIAVAGHSFGGFTAMAIAGQSRPHAAITFRDERVSAVIAMSAPAPKLGATWEHIDIPVLAMTGTLDDSPILGGTAQSRRDAFGQLNLADRYMVVFEGGDHMIFSGSPDALSRAGLGLPGMNGDRSRDKEFQGHVRALSLAFLDGYLRGNQAAKQWLTDDSGAKAILGGSATWMAKKADAIRSNP